VFTKQDNKMKYFLIILIFFGIFVLNSGNAYTFDGHYSKYVILKNKDGQSKIYAKLYNNKEVLIYTVKPIFPENFNFVVDESHGILVLDLACNSRNVEPRCNIVFNRRTGEYVFYHNWQGVNPIENVVFLYDKKNSLATIKPLFKRGKSSARICTNSR
jgi:hypothetical protein